MTNECKLKWNWLAIILIFTAVTGGDFIFADDAPASLERGYLIGPGDVLDITVWKNSDLTKVVTVLPDGKISYPLIGEINAADRTVAQLTEELRKGLNRFIPDVSLNITVTQVNSLFVYVIGRVNNPGRLVLNTNINVMQALAMAGGLNPFAKRGGIKIFRESVTPAKQFKFNYDDVAKGEAVSQNIVLRRGDVIYVP